MANITENDSYDSGVYQYQTTDAALGGPTGVMNTPLGNLANRTRYLLNRLLDGALKFITDSSAAAGTITLNLTQIPPALVDGMEVTFRVANLNPGAVNLQVQYGAPGANPTTSTLPLYGGDHVAMAGGELPVGAIVRAKLNLQLNASNGGAWVAQAVTGGYARIPTAPIGDTTTKAANMAAVSNATDGLATISVSVGANITLTAAQYGCAMLKLTGTPTAPITLLLPAGVTGQWIINNQQGGANNITVQPAGGAGVILPQPSGSPVATIVMSDGATASFASAQAGQAAFTIVPIASFTGTSMTVPGGYSPGAIMIEKNGILLEPTNDYTAPTSPTVTLVKPAASTDVYNVYRFNSFTVANAVQKSGDTMGGPLGLAAGSTGVTPSAGDSSTNVATTATIPAALQSISASVASSALTLGFTPVGPVQFRNPALTSGVPVWMLASAIGALSLTVPSGATLGTVAGQQATVILMVAYNAGAPVLCVANLAGGLVLDETNLISPTTISAGATSASTIYSAAAVAANSPYRVIGMVEITEATAGTWATAPTLVQGSGGKALAALTSLGYGQTAQLVSASRAFGTTYYNTTDKPIVVNVYGVMSAGASALYGYLNGTQVFIGAQVPSGGGDSSITFIVPPGFSYSVQASTGTASTPIWAELR
jgi:hypothetical protein